MSAAPLIGQFSPSMRRGDFAELVPHTHFDREHFIGVRPYAECTQTLRLVVHADAVVASFLAQGDFLGYRVFVHKILDELLSKSGQERFCLRSVAFGLLGGLFLCLSDLGF